MPKRFSPERLGLTGCLIPLRSLAHSPSSMAYASCLPHISPSKCHFLHLEMCTPKVRGCCLQSCVLSSQRFEVYAPGNSACPSLRCASLMYGVWPLSLAEAPQNVGLASEGVSSSSAYIQKFVSRPQRSSMWPQPRFCPQQLKSCTRTQT